MRRFMKKASQSDKKEIISRFYSNHRYLNGEHYLKRILFFNEITSSLILILLST